MDVRTHSSGARRVVAGEREGHSLNVTARDAGFRPGQESKPDGPPQCGGGSEGWAGLRCAGWNGALETPSARRREPDILAVPAVQKCKKRRALDGDFACVQVVLVDFVIRDDRRAPDLRRVFLNSN